jgi:hypothetical protein
VEGVNMGGFLLGYLGILVFGLTSLPALGLLIARKTTAARILFAAGLWVAAVIVAVAVLSFLQREFHGDELWPLIVLAALVLLLSGTGQFVAALRSPRTYGAALACAAGAMAFLAAPLLGGDFAGILLSARDLNPAAVRLIQALSLLLAAASLMIAFFPPQRRGAVPWTAQALLGAIAGFLVGDAAVATRCTLLAEEGRGTPVRVEVFVLGVRVSEETGTVRIPDDGPSSLRALSAAQAAWVYGTPAAGAVAGIIAALGLAASLVRQAGGGVHAEPLAEAEGPREHRSSSDKIKPV